MVKMSFKCRGYGFHPGLGKLKFHMPCGVAKNKENRTWKGGDVSRVTQMVSGGATAEGRSDLPPS